MNYERMLILRLVLYPRNGQFNKFNIKIILQKLYQIKY